jgi:predicted DNA-binding mobile mystery protein A
MDNKKLQIQQLDKRIQLFAQAQKYPTPNTGWIRSIRSALGMTLLQLANKLSITKQGAKEVELREQEGAITLKSLRETARAMDMELVYGFVPIEGSLEKHVEKKAYKLAKKIVMRTSNNMKLEDQENSTERIKKAIEERTALIKQELPKSLWD